MKPLVPADWIEAIEALVVALSARTLLLQFLAIVTQNQNRSDSVLDVSFELVAYVELLKRIDLIARELFGKLRRIEAIPLERKTINGARAMFMPNFEPFLSFGLWQANLVHFDETIDANKKWWLLKNDALITDQNLITDKEAGAMLAMVQHFELFGIRKKEEFFAFCAKHNARFELALPPSTESKAEASNVCKHFAALIADRFSEFTLFINLKFHKLYWNRELLYPKYWPFPRLFLLNDSNESSMKMLLVYSLILRLAEFFASIKYLKRDALEKRNVVSIEIGLKGNKTAVNNGVHIDRNYLKNLAAKIEIHKKLIIRNIVANFGEKQIDLKLVRQSLANVCCFDTIKLQRDFNEQNDKSAEEMSEEGNTMDVKFGKNNGENSVKLVEDSGEKTYTDKNDEKQSTKNAIESIGAGIYWRNTR